MATDATGTPTPLGIPKYNTSADAPSGLGFNAAMDSVDTLIAGRMTAPSSPATGDVPVWNGAAWVKSSTTKMAVAGITPGTDGQVITTTGGATAWGAAAGDVRYRKTTEKVVNTTAAETDLLNGEITVAAGAMSTNKMLRATLLGSLKNNTGASRAHRFRIKLGGTTFWDFDFDVGGRDLGFDADLRPFMWDIKISNLGATNSQFMVSELKVGAAAAGTTGMGVPSDVDWSAALAATQEGRVLVSTNGALAVDTTVACAFVVTVQPEISDVNLEARLKYALIEVV